MSTTSCSLNLVSCMFLKVRPVLHELLNCYCNIVMELSSVYTVQPQLTALGFSFGTEPDIRMECLYWAGGQVLTAAPSFSFSLNLNFLRVQTALV